MDQRHPAARFHTNSGKVSRAFREIGALNWIEKNRFTGLKRPTSRRIIEFDPHLSVLRILVICRQKLHHQIACLIVIEAESGGIERDYVTEAGKGDTEK